MIDNEEFIMELGWWVDGRLAHNNEFENNALGEFIRIKFKVKEFDEN